LLYNYVTNQSKVKKLIHNASHHNTGRMGTGGFIADRLKGLAVNTTSKKEAFSKS